MWIYFCYISPSKPATTQSPGSVCHTTLHKLHDLYSSWCSKCAVIAQSHMDSGVFIVSHQIYSSAVHVIMMPALAPHHHLLFPSQPFCMLFKVIVIMPVHCLCISIRPLVQYRLIGGNAFVLWCDWASAVISAVMTRAGRCYRSRFGGAILLTRSLLRQAASNTALRCVISSKACPCQTVGDLRITFIVIECDAEAKLECFSWENLRKKGKWMFIFFSFFVCGLNLWIDLDLFF